MIPDLTGSLLETTMVGTECRLFARSPAGECVTLSVDYAMIEGHGRPRVAF